MIISPKEIDIMIKQGKIIILRNNKVYDITNFNFHPGGFNCLQKKNGKDVSYDYNFHSKNAKKIWKKFLIGYIKKENTFCNIM